MHPCPLQDMPSKFYMVSRKGPLQVLQLFQYTHATNNIWLFPVQDQAIAIVTEVCEAHKLKSMQPDTNIGKDIVFGALCHSYLESALYWDASWVLVQGTHPFPALSCRTDVSLFPVAIEVIGAFVQLRCPLI